MANPASGDLASDERELRASASGMAKAIGAALIALAVLAAAAPLLTVLSPRFVWLAFALASTGVVGGAIALRRAPVTALLTVMLFLGGIAQLWLTEPDWFSEFRPLIHDPIDLAMLAALGVEAAVALFALLRGVGARRLRAAIAALGGRRLLVLCALTGLSSTLLLRHVELHDPIGYLWRVAFLTGLAAIHAGLVAAIAAASDLPALWPMQRAARAWSARAPLLLAGLAMLVALLLALLAFRGMALVEDETVYLFHARTLAGGMLMAPPLPAGTADALQFFLIESTPAGWFATTAPGFPAVLALGVLAGVPCLVNPLLGGAAIWLAHRLTERWSDRWTANMVALLMAVSPWMLETSASLMTHALSLALITGGWLLVTIAHDRQRERRGYSAALAALAAGLLMGLLFLNRALEGLLIGVLSGLWLVWTLRLAGWRTILFYGLGCMCTGALVFPYNAFFTGNPLSAPLQEYDERNWGPHSNDFGFGKDRGPPTDWGGFDIWHGHSPLEGLINTLSGLRMLDADLFGWMTGSLLLVWCWLIWSRKGSFPRAMALVAAVVIFAHFFYWFNALAYIGARYWYAAFFPLVVLSAFGARELIARAERGGVADAEQRVLGSIVILAAFGLAVFVPWRGIEKFSVRSADGAAIAAAIERPDMRDTVVFLDKHGFERAATLNDPYLRRGRPILARDLGPQSDARVLAAFPGRRAVFLRLPDETGTPPSEPTR